MKLSHFITSLTAVLFCIGCNLNQPKPVAQPCNNTNIEDLINIPKQDTTTIDRTDMDNFQRHLWKRIGKGIEHGRKIIWKFQELDRGVRRKMGWLSRWRFLWWNRRGRPKRHMEDVINQSWLILKYLIRTLWFRYGLPNRIYLLPCRDWWRYPFWRGRNYC